MANTNLTHVQKVRILYKTIARLHRGLPMEMQSLGNSYARDEFKRHKKCTPEQASLFMHEWTEYAVTLSRQLGLKGLKSGTSTIGKPLTQAELEHFRDEQIQQLYELMLSASDNKSGTDMKNVT